MTKKVSLQIFLTAFALILTAYFTRLSGFSPYAGVCICLAVFIVINFVILLAQRSFLKQDIIAVSKINSISIFLKTQLFAKMGLALAVLFLFNMILLDETLPLYEALWTLVFVFSAVILLSVAVYYLIAKRLIRKFDQSSLFVFGVLFWSLAAAVSDLKILNISLNYALSCVGISFMFASLQVLNTEVKFALPFFSEINVKNVSRLNRYCETKVQLFSEIITLVLVVVFYFLLTVKNLFSYVLFTLPAVFLLIACIYSMKQPLDKKSIEKIQLYRSMDENEEDTYMLSQWLEHYLMYGKNKAGLKFLIFLVRPFFPCKCVGKEKIKNLKEPVVFVGNHYEIYGPVVSVLRMPVSFRPWTIVDMVDENLVEAHMKEGVDNACHVIPSCIRKHIPKRVKKLVIYIMHGVRPIPVYRGNLREVIKTINMTVEAMEQGDNIMLFPEKPEANYSQGGVDKFYSGFSEIGNAYYKKTGKSTTFFPVYISKKKKRIFIGDGVKFDASLPKAEEKRRVASLLHQRMEEMSVKYSDGPSKKVEK